jgi:hypothetical protein
MFRNTTQPITQPATQHLGIHPAKPIGISTMHAQTHQPDPNHDPVRLLHQVIDAHDRVTRLYASVCNARHGLIDITLSSTFSGSSRPNLQRVLWQSALPPQAILALRDVLDQALTASESPEPISTTTCGPWGSR